MKSNIPQLPPTDAVQKFLTEFDAAQAEILRLRALAMEKSKEEEQLVADTDLNDRDSFKALADCRMMRELIPSKIDRLHALADALGQKSIPSVVELSASVSRAVNAIHQQFKERLDTVLRPMFENDSERHQMVGIVLDRSELGIHLSGLAVGASVTGAVSDGGIVAGRRLLDVVAAVEVLLPKIRASLAALGSSDSKR